MTRSKAYRFGFIAFFTLSLCSGIPGQARAMTNGGCDGSVQSHRKSDDVVSFVGMIAHKLRSRVAGPCKNAKRFHAPTTSAMAASGATQIDAAEAPVLHKASQNHGMPAAMIDMATPPQTPAPPPAEKTVQGTVIERKTATASHTAKMAKLTALLRRGHKPTYEVTLNVPRELATANGIVPGNFPALLLYNQKQSGDWGKAYKMVAAVKETENGYLCQLVLKHSPPKNSAVEVDFQNDHTLEVTSGLLLQGAASETVLPKPKKKQAYQTLVAHYPVTPNRVMTAVRFAAPTLIRSGMAFAVTGPGGLIAAPLSLVSDIAMSKIARNQRRMEELKTPPPLQVEYAISGQQKDIDQLKAEVEALKAQLASLGQTGNLFAIKEERK